MTQQIERWEYWTCFLEANAEREQQFLAETLRQTHVPKYAVESLVPSLNRFGQEGWELVSIRPAVIGDNADVLAFEDTTGSRREWTSTYLCTFKRRLP
jgi:hypothetical protein